MRIGLSNFLIRSLKDYEVLFQNTLEYSRFLIELCFDDGFRAISVSSSAAPTDSIQG